MTPKQHAVVWGSVLLAVLVFALLARFGGDGQQPHGRPNHYLHSATPAATR